MMNPHRAEYDVIVVGAGPAGLASAIFCSRNNHRVLLLEKAEKIGPEPRGETLHDDPILDDLLGEGFMESIKLSKTAERIFHAPDVDEIIRKMRKTPSIVFPWDAFVNRLGEQMNFTKVELKLNSEVTELILNQDVICGVVYKDQSGEKNQAFSKVILACDGHDSIIGAKLGYSYDSINFPVVKSLMKNGNYEGKGFRYFFVPTGALEFAPEFPPMVAFVFPRDDKNLECGLMIQTDLTAELSIPEVSGDDITQVWVRFKDEYPVFSDIVRNCPILYEKITAIPMTGPVESYIPRKGIILVGDAAGFVEVSGGSGLVTSIKMAKKCSEIISDALKASDDAKALWTDKIVNTWESSLRKCKTHKHVERTAKIYNWLRKLIFVRWRDSEHIMKRWWIIKLLMKFS